MARPVNANPEETRRKILTSASDLFAAHGFKGTSVRQIACGAGVSLGMIRHYYGSKEGLHRACLAVAYQVYGELGKQIRAGIAAGGTPSDVVGEAARTAYRFASEHKAAFKLTLWDLMARQSYRNEMGDRYMLPFIISTAKLLAKPLGRTVPEVALATRTIIFAVARYATADYAELAYLLSGGSARARPTKHTAQAVEDHLVDAAKRLFRA